MSQSGTYFNSIGPIGTVTQLNGDTGYARPTAGAINVVGGLNINTVGDDVSTITVNLDNNVTISGFYTTTGGNMNLPASASGGGAGVLTINGDIFLNNWGLTNTFVGADAGLTIINTGDNGQNNTGIGFSALYNLTTAQATTAVGNEAGFTLTDGGAGGGANTIIGNTAYYNGDGSSNTIVGNTAAYNLGVGSNNNIIIGDAAGNFMTSNESSNIIIGSGAAIHDANTIRIGTQGSLAAQVDKCFIAGIVGVSPSSAQLVAINTLTGQLGTATVETTSTFDTDSGIATSVGGAIDMHGGSNINTSGATDVVTFNLNNTVSISGSMTAGTGFVATTGDVNIEAGNLDLPTTLSSGNEGVINIDGTPFIQNYAGNIFIGKSAGNFTLTAVDAINNTVIGNGSLGDVTTGANNSVFGEDSMLDATSATANSAFGASALIALLTGSANSVYGAAAGSNYTGSESNNVLFANSGTIGESNVMRLGTQGSGDFQQDTCYIAGIIGVTVSNQELVTINSSTGQLGVTSSGGVASTFDTDSGSAIPSGGVIHISGGSNINTSGATDVVTVNLDNTVSISGSMTAGTGFTATTGDVNIEAGNLDLPTTLSSGSEGVINIDGTPFIQNYAGNIFIGKSAGNFTLTSGSAINNTVIGNGSFGDITTGHNNCVFGEDSMIDATSASTCTAMGASSLAGLLTGTGNSVYGAGSGSNYVGSESNNALFANPGVASESNVLRLGTQGSSTLEQDTCYIAGIIGVTVSNQELVTINSSTGQLGVTSSGAVSSSFTTDSGTATPSSGVIDIKGGSNINTSGATNVVTVNLDNTVSVSGSITAATGLTATAGGITATGTSNINTTGSAITSINTGGTGALNLGNATGNVAVTGKLTASTGLAATTGGITATGTSNINTTGSSVTSINTGGTGALNLGNATGNTSLTGTLTTSAEIVINSGDLALIAGNIDMVVTNSLGSEGVINVQGQRYISNVGTGNVFMGYQSGNFSITGSANIGIGTIALASLSNGVYNICIGDRTGSNLTGSNNTAVGSDAMLDSVGANSNTCFGYATLLTLSTGSYNVAIGYEAGLNYTGSESSNLLISNVGTIFESNVIRIGTQGSGSNQQNACYIAGITGATVTGSAVLCSTSGQLGTIASSIKVKENITDIGKRSEGIFNLRPVSFNYIKDSIFKTPSYGLIAEEVDEVFPSLALYDDNNEPASVKYHELPVLLLNELKKSNERIKYLEEQLLILLQK